MQKGKQTFRQKWESGLKTNDNGKTSDLRYLSFQPVTGKRAFCY